MFANKMYKQLTFYLETCESGSMFSGILPDNMNIYALSAANPTESSWATYCPPQDQVNGKNIGSCLGDEFSVNWMENTMANAPSTYTLQEQFEAVKTATLGSNVMQWGDLTFTNEAIGVFQGEGSQNDKFLKKVMGFFSHGTSGLQRVSVNARDVEVNFWLQQFNKDKSDEEAYSKLLWELATTRKFKQVFDKFNQHYKISGIYSGTTNFECYQTLISELHAKCGKVNDQSTANFKYLFQFCAMYTNWHQAEFSC